MTIFVIYYQPQRSVSQSFLVWWTLWMKKFSHKNFFYVVPSCEETSFLPPSMVDIEWHFLWSRRSTPKPPRLDHKNPLTWTIVFTKPFASPTNYFWRFKALLYVLAYCNIYFSMVPKQISIIYCVFQWLIVQLVKYI